MVQREKGQEVEEDGEGFGQIGDAELLIHLRGG
jgi:hypothetical protein